MWLAIQTDLVIRFRFRFKSQRKEGSGSQLKFLGSGSVFLLAFHGFLRVPVLKLKCCKFGVNFTKNLCKRINAPKHDVFQRFGSLNVILFEFQNFGIRTQRNRFLWVPYLNIFVGSGTLIFLGVPVRNRNYFRWVPCGTTGTQKNPL